jgi:small nuclear ribonucleoprotein E
MHSLFRFVHLRTSVQVWLFDQPQVRLEGTIVGFDEYMNLVLEGAEEVAKAKGGERRSAMGKLLLKGDNITAILGVGGQGGGGSSSGSGGGAATSVLAAAIAAGGGGGGGGGEGSSSSSSCSSSSSSSSSSATAAGGAGMPP